MIGTMRAVYPGWRVLAGSFICAALAAGFTSYVFGMFVVPVTQEFGISRANVNNGMIAFMLGMGLLSPIVGHLIDRYSARRMVAVGGVVFSASLMLISRASSPLAMLVLIALPLSFGCAACGVLAANTVVVRWFRNRRGRALGILAVSTSAGGFAAQPLTALLIDAFGWRDALFLIGLTTLSGVLLMALLLVRNRPSSNEPGYQAEFPQAAGDPGSRDGAKPERIWTHRELLRNRNFWLVAVGIGIFFGSDQALLVSQVPYFQDAGFDLKAAALIVSVKAISAIGGKIVIGALADKLDLRLLFVCIAGAHAVLLSVYIVQPSFWVMIGFVALLGVAVGGVFPLWTTIMAWLFGSASYGTVMGLMSIIMKPFAILALRFIGEVRDRTGSYVPAFWVLIGLVFVSMLLISMLRPAHQAAPIHEDDLAVRPGS